MGSSTCRDPPCTPSTLDVNLIANDNAYTLFAVPSCTQKPNMAHLLFLLVLLVLLVLFILHSTRSRILNHCRHSSKILHWMKQTSFLYTSFICNRRAEFIQEVLCVPSFSGRESTRACMAHLFLLLLLFAVFFLPVAVGKCISCQTSITRVFIFVFLPKQRTSFAKHDIMSNF